MNTDREQTDSRPWYKEPWPWIIISIPGAAVVMGMITLYLALTNPDHLVVEEDMYRDIKSELRAQDHDLNATEPESPARTDDGDG